MASPTRTARLQAEDHRHLWHPFTQQREWEQEPPLIIERGRGVYLEDTDGHRYLDGVSSLWVNLHGHRKGELDHAPYCYRCPLDLTYPKCRVACADAVEDVLTRHHQSIAALVVEPMLLAAGGMITMPPGYLSKLRRLCTRYRVLLIADEVVTGFGRTGRMFACEHESVKPDLMAVSKGLTGGYLPLAATLTTERIYRAFLGRYEEFKTFFHGHSYTGNPLGCAVALANLDIFARERTLQRLQPKITALRRLLHPLTKEPHVGDIRQLGFLAGIELVRDRMTKEPYPLSDRVGRCVAAEARRLGLIIRPLGNVIVLMPPLSTTMTELRRMVEIVTTAIRAVTSASTP